MSTSKLQAQGLDGLTEATVSLTSSSGSLSAAKKAQETCIDRWQTRKRSSLTGQRLLLENAGCRQQAAPSRISNPPTAIHNRLQVFHISSSGGLEILIAQDRHLNREPDASQAVREGAYCLQTLLRSITSSMT